MIFGSIKDWRPASLEMQRRLLGENKRESRYRHSSTWINDGSLKQVDLYCLLKATFGHPNGFLMAARGEHSGNFVEWHYVLEKSGVILQLIGSSRFLELWLHFDDPEQTVKTEWKQFSNSIVKELEANQQFIADQKSKLEKWEVFLNTHWRLVQLLDYYYNQFSKICFHPPSPLPRIATKNQANKYSRQLKRFTDEVFQKRNTGLIVRILVPIAIESLINLTILILAVESVRRDRRLLEDTFRKAVDIRLKTLHLFCQGLHSELNQSDERFKQILRIMQNRNDLLHGNVEPHTNTIDVVYFDGTIPLLPNETDISVQFASETLCGVEDEQVKEDFNSIKGLRSLIVDALIPEVKEQYEKIIDSSQLGWRKDIHRLGLLFDEILAQAVMIRKS